MWKNRLADGIVRARFWILGILLACAVLSIFTIGKTNINYDLNRYLSDDTMTKRALVIMEEEFGSSEQLRLMFSDLDDDTLQGIIDKLNDLPQIQIADHDPEEGVREIDGKKWQLVNIALKDCDAAELVSELREMFPEAGTYYVGGSAAAQLDVQVSVVKEIPPVMMIAVAVVIIVLLLTSHAWLEPLVILIVLAVSIVINMGTNFIFPDVSFITFSVCAILQLALSIDYAIMLLHTWNACSDDGMSPANAMKEAIAQCFMRIASSAFTTVAGLLSLLFMSFTFGFDIGMVLSKGIVISFLCVFLLMPAITLIFQKPLKATRHRPLKLGGEHLAGAIWKGKAVLAAVLVLAVFSGMWLNTRNTYFYADSGVAANGETAKINSVFGISNPLVLLVPGGEEDEDYVLQTEVAERLYELKKEDGEPVVNDISAMVTTGAEALKYYTAQDVAEITGVNQLLVTMFFAMQGFGDSVRADKLLSSAGELVTGNETIDSLQKMLDSAREAFIGPNYSRMLLEVNFLLSDDDFTANMESILAAVRETYGDDYYITGLSMSSYDIGNAFHADLLKVNLITLLAILLIVMISFRSFLLPVVLVFVIEGAIWITMGISSLAGQSIFFISYLICLAIQMGATIDYGILLSDQYRSLRRNGLEAKEALCKAMEKALPTVLTSGIILITAGFIIGVYCSIYYISSIGLLISRGALISVILVLTLLPALLALFDRWIIKK